MNNAPDNDRSYNRTCPAGHRWHLSEGGCGQCDIAREQAAMEPCECGCVFEEGDFVQHGKSFMVACPKCENEVWR